MCVVFLTMVPWKILSGCYHAKVRTGGKRLLENCETKYSRSANEALRGCFDALRMSFEASRKNDAWGGGSGCRREKHQKSLGFRREDINRCRRGQVNRAFVSHARLYLHMINRGSGKSRRRKSPVFRAKMCAIQFEENNRRFKNIESLRHLRVKIARYFLGVSFCAFEIR